MSASRRFEAVGEFHVATEQELDDEGLVERVGSTSFVANLPASERAGVLEKVRKLAPKSGSAVLRYDTVVYGYRNADVGTDR